MINGQIYCALVILIQITTAKAKNSVLLICVVTSILYFRSVVKARLIYMIRKLKEEIDVQDAVNLNLL
jgi:hypothetical protein